MLACRVRLMKEEKNLDAWLALLWGPLVFLCYYSRMMLLVCNWLPVSDCLRYLLVLQYLGNDLLASSSGPTPMFRILVVSRIMHH